MTKSRISIGSEMGSFFRKMNDAEAEGRGDVYKIQPVDLETFVMSDEYLGQNRWGMSEAQREFLKIASDLDNGIKFLVLFVGKGGGKNWAAGILFLYVIYKLLCMYDPHDFLDHNRIKHITLLNVAINADQARDNFFIPMTNILRFSGRKAFKEFGFDSDNDIQHNRVIFPNDIQIISANSRAGGIEGYDVLLALADEVDDVEFHSVDKILTTLRSSSASRFKGREKIIAISYRRYEGSSGKILELYNSAVGQDHIYARRYASWEFHPQRTRDDFKDEFNENPEKAECIYGSTDSGSFMDSWIKDSKRIKSAMNLNRKSIIDWPLPYETTVPGTEAWWARESHREWRNSPMSEHTYVDDDGVLQILDPYKIPIREFGDPSKYYAFVGDPGLGSEANGGDGYGVCLAHRETVVDENGLKHVRPVIDFVFRFTGRMFEEGQVQIRAIEELIISLKEEKGYNIKVFSFDGWNCLSSDAKILTTNGYRTASELSLGDSVVSQDGSMNKVTSLEIKEDLPSTRIVLDNGIKLTATNNHPVLVKGKGFVHASSLEEGDRLVHAEHTSFGTYSNVDKAIMYGYLVAEGDWGSSGTSYVRMHNTEKEVQEDYHTAISRTYPGLRHNIRDALVSTHNKNLLQDILQEAGSGGAHHKYVPEFVWSSDRQTVGGFLSSLYEGGGNVSIDKPRRGGQKVKVEYTTVSERLSREVQLLLSQLGIKSYRRYYTNKYFNGTRKPYYRITVSGRQIRGFAENVGFRSTRKQDKLKEALSLLKDTRRERFVDSAKVVSITPTTSDIVHLEVSGDHTYVAESLVNHNSASLTQLLQKKYRDTIILPNNLVDIKDYTVLRDCIFGEAPPSNGKGTKQTNGGIDIPWHPILFEEFRELREDRQKKKVDHVSSNTKDMSDTVAKACKLLIVEWPYREILVAGSPATEIENMKKVANKVATEEEKKQAEEEIFSHVAGMGSWKNLTTERSMSLEKLLPGLDI